MRETPYMCVYILQTEKKNGKRGREREREGTWPHTHTHTHTEDLHPHGTSYSAAVWREGESMLPLPFGGGGG